MKRVLALVAALTLLVALNASAAITFTVDEYGKWTSTDGALVPGMGAPSVNFQPTLDYTLPTGVNVTEGAVLLYEDTAHTVLSDVIIFDPPPPALGNVLYFYSDNTEGSDSLADVGIPANLSTYYPLEVSFTEVGLEGNNGYWGYTPTSGQPGYEAGQVVTYNFISDVPEPSTVVAGMLLLLPFGASTLRILRKR
jgi:hypothetical protein